MMSTPLHFVGQSLRELLLMMPLWGVRLLFLGLIAAVLLWVLRLPKNETTSPDRDGHRGANLKIGAAIALGLQLVIYSLL